MAQNIKTSTLPPKLAPYISIIPTFQFGNNQEQNVSEFSQNQSENSKDSKNNQNTNNNLIYQQSNHITNKFSSNNNDSTNEINENKNAIFNPISNIPSLIQNPPEIIPQTLKMQIPLINPLNSHEPLINSPNLANRSNIDIILNNSAEDERKYGDNRFNNNKSDPVITKKSNINPHQIISPKNLINPSVNLNLNHPNDNCKVNIGNLGPNSNKNNRINVGNDFTSSVKGNMNESSNDVNANLIEDSSLLPASSNIPTTSKSSGTKNKKSPAYRKVMWTHAEDQLLIKTISRHGTNNWELVSNEVAGRTRKQCRERWAGILNPSLTKQPWTTEEDETLKMLHAQYGNKWAMIAAQMKGRSTIALRNRWSFHMRHAYREVKQAPFRFVIENRNGDFNHDSTNMQLSMGMNQQQMAPVIQQQQSQNQQQNLPMQTQNQLQLIQPIQVMSTPYNQVQQQNICRVFPVINQPQKQLYQPNQIQMQNLHHYPPIQIIPQPYEQQQIVNAPMKVVELKSTNVNNPSNFG